MLSLMWSAQAKTLVPLGKLRNEVSTVFGDFLVVVVLVVLVVVLIVRCHE